MADNMGGISDAWFAFSMQIASVSQEADKVKVGLKSGGWINLHPGRYGTSIKVEPQESESGTLYNVSGSLQIPRQYMTSDLWQKCERLNHLTAIFKYKHFSGDTFVVGSDRFPLKCKFEVLHPSDPSGVSGYKISLSGKQLVPQLQLID